MSSADYRQQHREVHLYSIAINLNMKLLIMSAATVALLRTVVVLARGP